MDADERRFWGLSGLTAALFLVKPERKPLETLEILSRLDALQVKLATLSRDLGQPQPTLFYRLGIISRTR